MRFIKGADLKAICRVQIFVQSICIKIITQGSIWEGDKYIMSISESAANLTHLEISPDRHEPSLDLGVIS